MKLALAGIILLSSVLPQVAKAFELTKLACNKGPHSLVVVFNQDLLYFYPGKAHHRIGSISNTEGYLLIDGMRVRKETDDQNTFHFQLGIQGRNSDLTKFIITSPAIRIDHKDDTYSALVNINSNNFLGIPTGSRMSCTLVKKF